MKSYEFSQTTLDSLESINEKIIFSIQVLNNNYFLGITVSDRNYVINGAIEMLLDSPEMDCCQAYRIALIRCARQAQNYLEMTWSSVINFLSGNIQAASVQIISAGNPFQIANDVYPCIRAADQEYRPCCNQ